MRHAQFGAVTLAAALALAACSESVIDPAPTPVPTPPPRAQVVQTIGAIGLEYTETPTRWVLKFDARYNEFGGVPALIHVIRIEVYEKDGTFIEANGVFGASLPGGNAIPASGVTSYSQLRIGFNTTAQPGRYLTIIADVVDANGYTQSLVSGKLVLG